MAYRDAAASWIARAERLEQELATSRRQAARVRWRSGRVFGLGAALGFAVALALALAMRPTSVSGAGGAEPTSRPMAAGDGELRTGHYFFGKVLTASGDTPLRPGTSCIVDVMPGDPSCEVHIACGSYTPGSGGVAGACWFDADGFPSNAKPYNHIDLSGQKYEMAAGRIEIARFDPARKQSLVIVELEPPPPPPSANR